MFASAQLLLLLNLGGCGEDATDLNQTGGAAGTAGSSGSAGSAGSAGTAGTAGSGMPTGGSSGTAGSAGAAVGGASGGPTGGSSGTAGTSPVGGSSGLGGAGASGAAGSGGDAGSSGTAGSASGMGGSAGDGGTGGVSGSAGTSGSSGAAGTAGTGGVATEPFSFFLTSLDAVRRESGSEDGFGGDLGGLEGADAICTRIAESSMPGAGAKGWRAFLSTTTVDAISRIGEGPWYDRLGNLISEDIDGLLAGDRPATDPQSIGDDLPNETGVPNQAGTGNGDDDNHDTITGSDEMGEWDGGSTCDDWTSAEGSDGPRVGHSWPAGSGMHWIEAHTAPGCEPSVQLVQMGGGSGNGIGNGGGYGGFYCFALMP
jgi:hypothetical protein